MTLRGWIPDYPDAINFLEQFESSAANNPFNFSNATYDNLLNQARQTPVNRWSTLQEAEKYLVKDEAAIAPLYQGARSYLTKSYVKDLYTTNHALTNYKWVYINK